VAVRVRPFTRAAFGEKKKIATMKKLKPLSFVLCPLIVLLSALSFPLSAFCQGGNPILDFLNPTNTFLTAQEINLTLDSGYQRSRGASVGAGLRWWISDSQGAAVSYNAFPETDKGEWQIAYGYRTAYRKMELDFFVGMAHDVDSPQLLFRPYVEVDAIYQFTDRIGAGLKFQVTDNERPFAGVIFTYKFKR
jgi:hypothetical protein